MLKYDHWIANVVSVWYRGAFTHTADLEPGADPGFLNGGGTGRGARGAERVGIGEDVPLPNVGRVWEDDIAPPHNIFFNFRP